MKTVSLRGFLPNTELLTTLKAKFKIAYDKLSNSSEYEQLHRQLEYIASKNLAVSEILKATLDNLSDKQRQSVKELIQPLDLISQKILNREDVSKKEAEAFIKATQELEEVLKTLPDNLQVSLQKPIQVLVKVLENSEISVETKKKFFDDTLLSLQELGKLPEELKQYLGLTKEVFIESQKEILEKLKSEEVLKQFREQETLKELISKFDELLQGRELLEKTTKEKKSLAEKFLEAPSQLSRGRTLIAGGAEALFTALGMPAVGSVIGDVIDSGLIGGLLGFGLGKFGGLIGKAGKWVLKGVGLGKVLPKLSTVAEASRGAEVALEAGSKVGLVSKGLGLLGRVGSKLAIPLTVLLTGFDAYKGWKESDKIFHTQHASLGQKISGALGSAISGLTLGLIPKEWASQILYKVGSFQEKILSKLWNFGKEKLSSQLLYKVGSFQEKILSKLWNFGKEKLSSLLSTYSKDSRFLDKILDRQIQVESGGNPYAVSHAGAIGLAQFMPSTWKDIWEKRRDLFVKYEPELAKFKGIPDIYDPKVQRVAQRAYMKYLLDKFHDIRLALAAYNAGEGRVSRLVSKYGDNFSAIYQHLPKETQSYIAKILTGSEKVNSVTLQASQVDIQSPVQPVPGTSKVSQVLASTTQLQSSTSTDSQQKPQTTTVVVNPPQEKTDKVPPILPSKHIDSYGIAFTNSMLYE